MRRTMQKYRLSRLAEKDLAGMVIGGILLVGMFSSIRSWRMGIR